MPHLVNEKTGDAIKVPQGESSVGRGPLLEVTDKRVSRNHALLQHKDGKLKLCPKHKNPCFYQAVVGGGGFTVLTKDSWQELYHGDRFSLLPNDLIFRVVGEKEENKPVESKDHKPTATSDPVDELFESMDTAPAKPSDTLTVTDSKSTGAKEDVSGSEESGRKSDGHSKGDPADAPKSETAATQSVSDMSPPPKSKNKVPSRTLESLSSTSSVSSTKKPRTLPSWLTGISVESRPPPKKRKAPTKTVAKDDTDEARPPPPKKAAKKVESATIESSRGRTSDKDDKDTITDAASRKVLEKEEKEKKPEEPPRTKTTKTGAVTSAPTDSVKDRDAREKKADKKKLPLCPYGTKCYRKNPAHFREYSHDVSAADDDSEEDSDKPECPYGTACYRKNPAHRREYKHTAPPADSLDDSPPRHTSRRTKGTKKRSVMEGDSDDDDLPNTYDYHDSFIDDEDLGKESSSYGGDSEDSDWAPDDDSEDVRGLVSDAKAFITNKKMRKPV